MVLPTARNCFVCVAGLAGTVGRGAPTLFGRLPQRRTKGAGCPYHLQERGTGSQLRRVEPCHLSLSSAGPSDLCSCPTASYCAFSNDGPKDTRSAYASSRSVRAMVQTVVQRRSEGRLRPGARPADVAHLKLARPRASLGSNCRFAAAIVAREPAPIRIRWRSIMANPGWYPDPNGTPQERWWNGDVWTDATRPYDAPQPMPTMAMVPVVASYVTAPTAPGMDGSVAARRGYTLGVIAASFAAASLFGAFIGLSIFVMTWLLAISMLLFVPASTVIGIIGIVFSSIGLKRTTGGEARQHATIGLVLSIIGAVAFLLVVLAAALSAATK
jgi:hypothetical protein